MGDVTPAEARAAAGRELGRIAGGADPAEEKREARAAEEKRRNLPTVAELADRYLAEHVAVHCRPRTQAEYRGLIERHVKPRLGNIRIADLEQTEIAELQRGLRATPVEANRTLAVIRQMLNVAVKLWKLRPDNPAVGLARYGEEKRQRFLSAAELGRLAQALIDYPYRISANAVRLLLLTGARRGEVLAMRWEEVERELGVWIKPSAHTKQKREHRVPLSPGARQLLADMQKYRKPGAPYVFPGRGPGEHLGDVKKPWATLCKRAQLGDMVIKTDKAGKPVLGADGKPVTVFEPTVRLHDLRHTYASVLVSSGLSLPVIGALLGHTQPSTTHRYAHLASEPLQEATNRVDALLTALAADRQGETVALRKRPS